MYGDGDGGCVAEADHIPTTADEDKAHGECGITSANQQEARPKQKLDDVHDRVCLFQVG